MNNLNPIQKEIKPHIRTKFSPKSYEGIYHSRSINKAPADVYAFCQNEVIMKRVLQDLPEKTENFMNLEFISADKIGTDMYQIEWKNKKDSKIQGSLFLDISPDAHKGSVVIANGIFGDYKMSNEEPSDLINLFLKRVKALCETGQIATTTGQPNGKDEKEMQQQLKH
ncbi:MAG: hypothetical protein H7177_17455 [Rhizobacter sp.]|nr:hypothetical protein [Bacteriovorax sp.]